MNPFEPKAKDNELDKPVTMRILLRYFWWGLGGYVIAKGVFGWF